MYAGKITQQALDALNEYFTILSQTGYIEYNKVKGILGLLLVDSFLNTELNTYVTEEDYNIMVKFLYCIYGKNCLIPYPQFLKEIPQLGTILPGLGGIRPYRDTEDEILRFTEQNSKVRATEYNTGFWDN